MAPGDDGAQAAAMLAEELAVGLDDSTVEKARAYALERFEAEETD